MVRANKNVAFLVTIILFCNIFLFSKQAQNPTTTNPTTTRTLVHTY